MDEIEPGGKAPAPGGLALVQAFINSNDIEEGTDELSSPELVGAWLSAHDLPGGDEPLTEADLTWAVEVREALRSLAGTNNGVAPDPASGEILNRTASESHLVVRFEPDATSRLESAESGLAGALGQILANVQVAMIDGTWDRLKACRNDECRWVFYDHSRNRSGTWCTMSVCGDRLKARAYRQRHAHA